MGLAENLNTVSNEQFQQLLEYKDRQTNALKMISESEKISFNRVFKINSWRDIQNIVSRGEARKYFKIGDQFQSYHGTYGTGADKMLTWDIIGIDHDIAVDENGNQVTTIDASGNVIPAYTMTIQLHNYISTKYAYNQRLHTETGTTANNWRDSDIRLWLNTDDVINGYSANKGFLDKFDPDLFSVVGYCAKSTLRNYASGGDGGKAVKTIERFFLPSRTEVFARTDSTITDNTIPESAIFKSEDTTVNSNKVYYIADASNVLTVAIPVGTENPKTLDWYEIKAEYEFYGAEKSDYNIPSETSDANRRKNVGSNWAYWWLRTPNVGSTNYARYVWSDGGLSTDNATSQYGIAPACVIV